jgi:hypothetical protein
VISFFAGFSLVTDTRVRTEEFLRPAVIGV